MAKFDQQKFKKSLRYWIKFCRFQDDPGIAPTVFPISPCLPAAAGGGGGDVGTAVGTYSCGSESIIRSWAFSLCIP